MKEKFPIVNVFSDLCATWMINLRRKGIVVCTYMYKFSDTDSLAYIIHASCKIQLYLSV